MKVKKPQTDTSIRDMRTCTGLTRDKKRSITPHESRVYLITKIIPKGKLLTYGSIAKVIGSSPRAVGQALKKNPWAPIVPCHRVISAGQTIGGFSGHKSGDKLDKKRAMLADEGISFTSVSYKGQKSGGSKGGNETNFFSLKLSDSSQIMSVDEIHKLLAKHPEVKAAINKDKK